MTNLAQPPTKDPNAKLSKFLSLVLRHKPQTLGLSLDPDGYVKVDALLDALNRNPDTPPVSRQRLDALVATNAKQRFTYDASGTKIRASQGHSLAVDLGLTPRTPPDVLYHGTAVGALEAIWREGISKQTRTHVHLSATAQIAHQVGSRHGKPVVLVINAKAMQADGWMFWRSDNGVWLTEHVPTHYIHTQDSAPADLTPSV